MDTKVWEEPEQFRPERFLDKFGEVTGKERIMPFGVGVYNTLFQKSGSFIFFPHNNYCQKHGSIFSNSFALVSLLRNFPSMHLAVINFCFMLNFLYRGVDSYGTGGHVPQYLDWGTLSRMSPSIFLISATFYPCNIFLIS